METEDIKPDDKPVEPVPEPPTEVGGEGFVKPVSKPRNWENPPASREVKLRLKQGLFEIYYDLCCELDKLARAKQPMPRDIKIEANIDLTEK